MIKKILFQRTVPEGVTESRRTKQARLKQAFPCDSLEKLGLCEGAEGTSGFSVTRIVVSLQHLWCISFLLLL